MYLGLGQATDLLRRRWRDTELRERVRRFVGEVPEYLRRGPRAVLSRPLASPNLELFRFAERAAAAGLKACCAEFTGDKFHTGNPEKLLLGKMTFFHGRGRKRDERITTCRVIDVDAGHRRPFTEIRTLWGEAFVGFHHRLMAAELPEVQIVDCTAWLRRMGGRPELFWHRHLALFLCYGILFDNFHGTGHEAAFTREIIRPAFKTVERKFSLPPLVVALVPRDRERERYWSWYPGRVEGRIDRQPVPPLRRSRLRGG